LLDDRRWRGRNFTDSERLFVGGFFFVVVVACLVQMFVIVTRKYLTPTHLCNTVSDMANVLTTDKQTAIIAVRAAIMQEARNLDAEES
jgi:hypothetical protein